MENEEKKKRWRNKHQRRTPPKGTKGTNGRVIPSDGMKVQCITRKQIAKATGTVPNQTDEQSNNGRCEEEVESSIHSITNSRSAETEMEHSSTWPFTIISTNGDLTVEISQHSEEDLTEMCPLDATTVPDQSANDTSLEDCPIIDGVIRESSSPNSKNMEETKKKNQRRRRSIHLFLAILMVSAIVIISLSITLNQQGQSSPKTTTMITDVPSLAPSTKDVPQSPSPSSPSSPSPTTQWFQSVATTVYASLDPPRQPPSWSKEMLNDGEKATFRAMNWLANEDEASVPLNDTVRLRQRFSLAVIYFAMGGKNWKGGSGRMFLSREHECYWNVTVDDFWDETYDRFLGGRRGVFCLGTPGIVTNIYMINMNMSGYIPEEISMLSNLIEFSFKRNALSGKIPPTIWKLPNLSYVDLMTNKIGGSIPPLTRDLNVSYPPLGLSVSDNLLSGTIPSSLFQSDIFMLDLQYNLLSGEIPKTSKPNEHLIRFFATDNQLEGALPFVSGSFPNLSFLSLHSNHFLKGSIDSIHHLDKLMGLYLSDNAFDGSIPSSFSNLTNMVSLYLSINQLTGTFPESLWSLTNLTSLSVTDNDLVGSLPSEIGKLTNLNLLGVGVNRLNGTLPWTIGNMSKLETLYVHMNNISGSIPESIGKLTNMRYLSAFQNSLSGVIPSAMGNLTNLVNLGLYLNDLTGTLPSSFLKLTALDSLTLDRNKNMRGNFSFLCGEPYSNSIKEFYSDCLKSDLDCFCCDICCNATKCEFNES